MHCRASPGFPSIPSSFLFPLFIPFALQVQGFWQVKNEGLKPLCAEARELVKRFQRCKLQQVDRVSCLSSSLKRRTLRFRELGAPNAFPRHAFFFRLQFTKCLPCILRRNTIRRQMHCPTRVYFCQVRSGYLCA